MRPLNNFEKTLTFKIIELGQKYPFVLFQELLNGHLDEGIVGIDSIDSRATISVDRAFYSKIKDEGNHPESLILNAASAKIFSAIRLIQRLESAGLLFLGTYDHRLTVRELDRLSMGVSSGASITIDVKDPSIGNLIAKYANSTIHPTNDLTEYANNGFMSPEEIIIAKQSEFNRIMIWLTFILALTSLIGSIRPLGEFLCAILCD
jgi:hypothetical protein